MSDPDAPPDGPPACDSDLVAPGTSRGSGDLRGALAALLGPLREGDEIWPGARFSGASVELGLRLTFELDGRIVHVEVAPIDESPRFAARTDLLALSYRTGSGSGGRHITPQEGKALCERIASIAAIHEREVMGALALSAPAPALEPGGARLRDVRVSALLERSEWRGTRYYTVSPYVGCLIGCRFCYAQSRVRIVRRLERLPEAPWGSYVDARVNAPEVLAAELASMPVAPIKFCPVVSDPYHAIEARMGLTRRCLETLQASSRPFPTLLLTRSRLVERDAALLGSLPLAYAGMSIPTVDEDVRRHFEPRGASIGERLGALATLRAHGVRTFAVVQPMLPGPVEALADVLAEHVQSASLDVLTSLEGATADFADPRFRVACDPGWQRARVEELTAALSARGVVVWDGELPPELLHPARP